jgi:hypothetical protein
MGGIATAETGKSASERGVRLRLTFDCCLCSGDSQGEGAAGSAAGAAEITRVPARSMNRHARFSRSRDNSGRDSDLQLLTAHDLSAHVGAVDDYDRGRDKLTAIHGKKNSLLHLSESNSAGRKRSDHRDGPRTSTQRVECVAARENYAEE